MGPKRTSCSTSASRRCTTAAAREHLIAAEGELPATHPLLDSALEELAPAVRAAPEFWLQREMDEVTEALQEAVDEQLALGGEPVDLLAPLPGPLDGDVAVLLEGGEERIHLARADAAFQLHLELGQQVIAVLRPLLQEAESVELHHAADAHRLRTGHHNI